MTLPSQSRIQKECDELKDRIAALLSENSALEHRAIVAETKYSTTKEIADDLRERMKAADARIADLTDRISNAGDSLNLSFRGRRLFSKAPVEAPPMQRMPVNLSGPGKQLARDRARENTRDFFKKLAAESGVVSTEQN